jgi:hypothetical protein
MRTLTIVCAVMGVFLAIAGPADAQPAAPGTETPAPAAAPLNAATSADLKKTCMSAINSDQQWTDELVALIDKKSRYDAHQAEATLIATNKRHVVLAYAAMWLLAVAFLIAQWRRQQELRRQIAALRTDLAAAIKGSAT